MVKCDICKLDVTGNIYKHKRNKHKWDRGGTKLIKPEDKMKIETIENEVTFNTYSILYLKRLANFAQTLNLVTTIYGPDAPQPELIITRVKSQNETNVPQLVDQLYSEISARADNTDNGAVYANALLNKNIFVPPTTKGDEKYREMRSNLPIFQRRREIINLIHQNQVVVISSETGSGKTTQIPQYILEDCEQRREKCKIICTEPRRLAATSIATRIAKERGDIIGRSVGYQIRLDSRIGFNTNLIFTTSGFLLGILAGCEETGVFKNTTHLILDEVHEREMVTDFLLIVIREAMQANPNLKVVLMSATLNSEKFSEYFNGCAIIDVPGRIFDVQIIHLNEVLFKTGYKTSEMINYMEKNPVSQILRVEDADMLNIYRNMCDRQLDSFLIRQDDESIEEIFSLIENEYMPVNYVHRTKQRTALGIAAENGLLGVLTKLLAFGESPIFSDPYGKSAFDYAKQHGQEVCCELFACYQRVATTTTWKNYTEIAKAYRETQGTRNVIDHDLVFHVINHIHENTPKDGAILVFVPGYDDICEQKEKIESEHGLQDLAYKLFVLHSQVNDDKNDEQERIFDKMENGIRKIILSTNIAESALTIDDVIHVIDTGKAKLLNHDSETRSSRLELKPISQACAKQRSGRAGRIRNGYCYRLYSLEQYEMMQKYKLPEIVRVPLTQLCLHAKILAAADTSIGTFLSKALEPPPPENVRQSVELLKEINALDASESITDLGIHLARMPIDCQIAKMVLYAIVLRCLDPIVIIASALSVRDLFLLPLDNAREAIEKINETKNRFTGDERSDHKMFLNIIENWSKLLREHQRQFCCENLISQGNMLKAEGIRRLIFNQLFKSGLISQTMRQINENSSNWLFKRVLWPACTPITSESDLNNAELVVFEQKIQRRNGHFILKNICVLLRETKALLPKLEEILFQFARN
ncbi:DExH-box ATP-dependent RNA helicase DExH1-like [Contarinia nasturtii]|uniref:DExH-box ATP-dependent RNA helicase DExH1-like n=1 Tax=Contarinia nasturtii TaxID=265458 RepID=UPI0012D3C01B|nr:DExH-box ATP-dependent RNA helicase DExH1-like [Contarinia nasturtii]